MGRPSLSNTRSSTHFVDVERFLQHCNDENFLDFIEFAFQSQSPSPRSSDANDWISPSEINAFLDVCNLPYYLTDYVFQNQVFPQGGYRRDLVGLPRIIIRDNEVLHQIAIEPSLDLLQDQRWQSANDEFNKALQHFRKNEFEDCAAMCGSTLESVMKIICRAKGWDKNPDNLVASQLLDIIVSKSGLDPFYKKLLELTHVIRNTKSNVHGAGNQSRTVPQHVAQFVINMTAATILLLVTEVNV